jgi:uncharacterized protein (DUF2126 family)
VADTLDLAAEIVEAVLTRNDVVLTLGGEPTYLPDHPEGAEWSVAALGPTKLAYAYTLADALREQSMPAALDFYCPGKRYPGEMNPRWTISLVSNRAPSPLVPSLAHPLPGKDGSLQSFDEWRTTLLGVLGLTDGWLHVRDPLDAEHAAWVLPLDHADGAYASEDWSRDMELELLRAEGPAGLRLPLDELPAASSRRALTVEVRDGVLHIFLPPFAQAGFLDLLDRCVQSLRHHGIGPVRFGGQLPHDERAVWTTLGIAADPGVLEVNLPPCPTWQEYRTWLGRLEHAAAASGLRSWKRTSAGAELGTGGGNHLLFGGPSLDEHPLFTRPKWVASMLRYWQRHPSLAYLFSGQYVGPSSQAPRPDESAAALYDLELAYGFLESLPAGDHRYLISETLRHLHSDAGGNTHRSETSFDKFWNVAFDGGCRGLIEFRAIESLPRAEWMSAVALLWRALAAWLLEQPYREALFDFGDTLHDFYFLPSGLIEDFDAVLADLDAAGIALPRAVFDDIIAWRLPVLLDSSTGLIVRRALESWPLLCETPLEGGTTSRFVDTSVERLEFSAPARFASRVLVQGRELPLAPLPGQRIGAGLRYRRSALYPSLHPGVPVQLPLFVQVDGRAWRLDSERTQFIECDPTAAPPVGPPCRRLHSTLLTYDLRL